jgi:hypothetical protein
MTMPDMTSHDAPQRDELHTMTLTELEAAMAFADVLISRRQLMRHCEAGTFDAKRLPAVNNLEQWFIAPASIEKGIADIKTLQEQRARRDATRPDVSHHDASEETPAHVSDVTSHDAPQRAGSVVSNNADSSASQPVIPRHDATRPDTRDREEPWTVTETAGLVSLLEMQLGEKDKRIADKDRHIEFLQDELKDRRDQNASDSPVGLVGHLLAPCPRHSAPMGPRAGPKGPGLRQVRGLSEMAATERFDPLGSREDRSDGTVRRSSVAGSDRECRQRVG